MDILPCLKGQVKILGFFFSEEEKIKEFFVDFFPIFYFCFYFSLSAGLSLVCTFAFIY